MKTTATTGLHMQGLTRASANLAPFVLACLVAACGSGSDSDASGSVGGPTRPIVGAPGPQSAPATCAGADLSGLKSAIYVKSSGTDGPSCGTATANACKTIQQGINNCAVGGCGVLVRHGLYPTQATITLRDAVSVYGSCRFDSEADRKYRTTVQASPAPGTPAASAASINTATTFSAIVVLGKDETANGTASIAMAVNSSKGLTISNVTLAAGRGGDGATAPVQGAGGGDDGVAASGPLSGGAGGNACSANPPPSGVAGGGRGADSNKIYTAHHFFWAYCRNDNSAGTGPNGQNGQASGAASGGAGGPPGISGCACDDAPNFNPGSAPTASPGNPGVCAVSGMTLAGAWGSLSSASWLPSLGGAGLAGAVGSGGGGGGGGGYSANYNDNDGDISGYAGGGGGGGGCGGPGGAGGQQGGASIALALANAVVAGISSQQNSLIPGPAGHGGSGAQGASGGPGGAGQLGWRGFDRQQGSCGSMPAPGSGGQGGWGGAGGAGSGGAGGNGGPSIGIALVAGAPAPASTAGIYAGSPGAAGAKGAGGQNAGQCKAADGSDGMQGGSALSIDFDRPLGSILFAGQQLTQGQGMKSANGNNILLMQTDSNFCLYKSGAHVWCTNSVGAGIPAALMQTDGNLCLYPTNGDRPICSGTARHPGAYLIVQNDGHIQIIDEITVLWTKP